MLLEFQISPSSPQSQKDSPGECMATHSTILARWILRTEESGGPQSMGSQRVGHNCILEKVCFSYIPTHSPEWERRPKFPTPIARPLLTYCLPQDECQPLPPSSHWSHEVQDSQLVPHPFTLINKWLMSREATNLLPKVPDTLTALIVFIAFRSTWETITSIVV